MTYHILILIDYSGGCVPPYDQYFRGSCYRYLNFVLGLRFPEYIYLKTWQRTELACMKDNASLVAINDQDEAYFLKVSKINKQGIFITCNRSWLSRAVSLRIMFTLVLQKHQYKYQFTQQSLGFYA